MRFSSLPEQDRSLLPSLGIPIRTRSPRQPKAWLAGFSCATALLLAAPSPASAQGRLEAHYEASLAGISVGRGTWGIEIGEDYYSAAAQGATAGLLKAFSSGSGSGSVQGRIVNGALVPGAYIAAVNSKKSETIKINLAGGGVK